MLRKDAIPDDTISQKVTQQLSNRGLRSPCHIVVRTVKGDVTLSGTVPYQHQKHSALQVTRSVNGVRRVTDQLVVKAVAKY